MFQFLFKFLVLGYLSFSHPDELLLKNTEQLTSPSMGFEKAGEAYFSPDGQMIIFQAVPIGETGYQIFTMNLITKEIRQISQGAQACTCSFFRLMEIRSFLQQARKNGMFRKAENTNGILHLL